MNYKLRLKLLELRNWIFGVQFASILFHFVAVVGLVLMLDVSPQLVLGYCLWRFCTRCIDALRQEQDAKEQLKKERARWYGDN